MSSFPYGEAVALSSRVRRVTAPNSGPMTGPGTNSYLIGKERIALVDPGPAIDSHIAALIAIVGDRLKWIFVTHTHRDHSPAAKAVAAATGAELVGNIIENDGFQDPSFTEARSLANDECLKTDEFTLRAVLTPGHVSNHVCYLVEEDRMLITGDHIMGGSTVVIIPPAGDMADYIHSLERMLDYDLSHLAPGHGDLIDAPHAEVKHLIAHRLKRERKVSDALAKLGPCPLSALLPVVYDDVAESLHQMAAKSLLAHLLKLDTDGRAKLVGDNWTLVD
ncbi:MAG: MBL fold metallo-hydrolase [Proteobacteria bacterium]|nr:MBL fold metallo-hydrolase [Pseudomonadota bacterium]